MVCPLIPWNILWKDIRILSCISVKYTNLWSTKGFFNFLFLCGCYWEGGRERRGNSSEWHYGELGWPGPWIFARQWMPAAFPVVSAWKLMATFKFQTKVLNMCQNFKYMPNTLFQIHAKMFGTPLKISFTSKKNFEVWK